MIGGAAAGGRLPASPVVGDPGCGSTTMWVLSVAAGRIIICTRYEKDFSSCFDL
jgi:hypothetical protein